ncbi:hypothetical protein HZP42_07850 [Elizabethkingia anophelis]|uniref:hypothetical protein n=1 Tax=Elizabethkingia anophelis TaxID=1117645 RepID=UPI0006679693|nr:hypothetical protein [Elizabethkingia anophelis]AQW89516.1 hypothetical protein BBD28_02050 [Elizabethkingia anophelis]KUY22025.1 hypothetical protein ATB94_16790 [Elizabethkingia anophelis]MCT3725528.1 hypothetical protein [Elizabethkingia anophelis]MCT4236297.1 hypothetical protein [Elizabethkingia anophelis]MCT4319008.1 hypothetical protein [Elizabethkingia anophelis]
MKRILSIFLICSITTGISAQRKTTKKQPKKSSGKATMVDIAGVTDTASEKSEADTLKLKAGKAYVLLIDVAPNMKGVTVGGDDQEKNELIKNFSKNTPEIIQLYNYTYVLAENGQYIDLTGDGNTYQAVAYWSGKMDDNIVAQEGKNRATEFVATQLGQQKESSYITNSKKYKEEVKSLQGKNNFTKKSAEVMQAYLQHLAVPKICFIENTMLFNKDQSKIKTTTTYITGDNGKKQKYLVAEFNELGQPITITEYRSDEKSVQRFTYKDGILTNIQTPVNTTNINYDNDRMITSSDLGGGTETEIYRVEKNELLRKSYIIMKDDSSDNMNAATDEKIEKSCTNFYIDNIIQTSNCSSNANEFPFTHTSIVYQDGKLIQETKYRIEKKSSVLYESQYKRDNDIRKATYHLNDKGLLESYQKNDNNRKSTVWLEYTYFL